MELFNKTDFFRNLNNKEIHDVFSIIHYQKKKYYKNEIITHKGNVSESLKVILRGSAHTEMSKTGEKVIKIADIKAGQTIAISFVFGTNNIIPVNVIADEDTEILIIQKEFVMKMLVLNNKILCNFLNHLSNQTQFLANKIKFLNLNTIREKLMFFLKEQQNTQQTQIITLNITQQKLADLFGVTRPSLSRCLKELEYEGKIKHISRNKIKIL